RKHENIILETSAMPMHRKIKEAVEKVGEDRVIYGSDMPFGHPSFEIRKVEVSGLSEKQIEMVLSVNARKIFRL
ncbi:MAG: amidohydrolase family protein, partial [Candidatus Bathyarchaeia archaeon]